VTLTLESIIDEYSTITFHYVFSNWDGFIDLPYIDIAVFDLALQVFDALEHIRPSIAST